MTDFELCIGNIPIGNTKPRSRIMKKMEGIFLECAGKYEI